MFFHRRYSELVASIMALQQSSSSSTTGVAGLADSMGIGGGGESMLQHDMSQLKTEMIGTMWYDVPCLLSAVCCLLTHNWYDSCYWPHEIVYVSLYSLNHWLLTDCCLYCMVMMQPFWIDYLDCCLVRKREECFLLTTMIKYEIQHTMNSYTSCINNWRDILYSLCFFVDCLIAGFMFCQFILFSFGLDL